MKSQPAMLGVRVLWDATEAAARQRISADAKARADLNHFSRFGASSRQLICTFTAE